MPLIWLEQVDKSNTSAIFSNVKFKENVADGDGGALLVAEKSVDVILESGVEFTGNKARGGNGGAILIASGARISASVTEFTSNKGSEGGAVSMKVRTVHNAMSYPVYPVLLLLHDQHCKK